MGGRRDLLPLLRGAAALLKPEGGDLWRDPAPIRAELFSAERLERHAASLAAAQPLSAFPVIRTPSLQSRLNDNEKVLLAAFVSSARELAEGREAAPAAAWLLDNQALITAQIQEIRADLPEGYYRLLPKLAEGPFAGYPRVFGLAWAFVAHADSHLDVEILRRFLRAYQTVQPLTIGELWAVSVTLRLLLIENLRRLADQMTLARAWRLEADRLADDFPEPGQELPARLSAEMDRHGRQPLSEVFSAQIAKRLRDRDPQTDPALAWLGAHLAAQGASIDGVVRHAHERQGASNVSLRNAVTALRRISATDWGEVFESVSLVEARLRAHPGYAEMDFPSRNLYRSAVEQIARGGSLSEIELAAEAVARAAETAKGAAEAAADPRRADPGWSLIGGGRGAFEARAGFRPSLALSLRRRILAAGLMAYLGVVFGLTLLTTGAAVWGLWRSGAAPGTLALWGFATLFPFGAAAQALVARIAAASVAPTLLPGLDLRAGAPSVLRTLVAVPLIIADAEDLTAQIRALEVHHLSGAGGDLTFALLTDGRDAPTETTPEDEGLLALAAEEIAALNRRHPPGPAGPRFLHLHRARRFNAAEGLWMGWERKRGKLQELNRLLRGAQDVGFVTPDGQAPFVPSGVRYVLTLDADTRLPRDAAARLIGKMAHPLNRPRFDPVLRRVTEGYGILQPRVTPALTSGGLPTPFQRLASGPGGTDPYASAASDLYQDLFGEGSFTGKGIYDVDAFAAAMAGRTPENALLSHDLLEGIFVRAGLASDVEVVEAFPDRPDVEARRQHRWTRGDWQSLPWLFARDTPILGKVKIADNLRRSLTPPFALLALALGWTLPWGAALAATAAVLASLAFPAALPAVLGLFPRRPGLDAFSRLRQSAEDLGLAAARIGYGLACLPDAAWRMGDAIARALWRLGVSRRRMLEWTTAAQASSGPRPSLASSARAMAGGTGLGLAAAGAAAAASPASASLILPFALLWLGASILVWMSGRPPRAREDRPLTAEETRDFRLIARRTWRYFEAFTGEGRSALPPDNHQESPAPLTALRTSPTNVGLYLLSCVAACDFGWISRRRAVERLEAAMAAMAALPKHRGHLYNWHALEDGRVLEPRYVSTVDSGNLAAHLIALAGACEDWAAGVASGDGLEGRLDALRLARLEPGASEPATAAQLDEIERRIRATGPRDPALLRLTARALAALPEGEASADLRFWLEALRDQAAESLRDADPDPRGDLEERLRALGAQARAAAMAMEFGFLLDPERELLSIGFAEAANVLDPGCYDLLASEARLTSLFAVAKGDVPLRSWFRLGRPVAPLAEGPALLSWSGSMFEYLMPGLVLEEPEGGLLGRANRLAVARQQAYGRRRGLPWGVSESGFNARDRAMNYQYSNFGVPELALKRGLEADRVVAPYATGLAAMVDPEGALRNYAALARLGGRGRFGFYEALDFTAARLPEGAQVAVVRSYMAHHQGMTIVALANLLHGGRMRARFHAEPMIRAAELLLQERVPRDLAARPPQSEASPPPGPAADPQTRLRIEGAPQGSPTTHLLSNGRYSVLMTARGAGYSRWGAIALTRWTPDPTRETGGAQIWLKDLWDGTIRSVGGAEGARRREARFFEDRVVIAREEGTLATEMETLVSGEGDAEARRVSIRSTARRTREVELTSYLELALAAPEADDAHPAFSKMFVQTEHLPEFGALIATRRPRSPEEPTVWAAHFVVVEGEAVTATEYETDRAAFLGRDNDAATAQAVFGEAGLTGRLGTVLDPVFALRQRLRIPPNGAARLTFWTVAASSREALIALIDRHQEPSAFERARTLAWTQAQVQLRHLGASAVQAAAFQRLTAPILYPDARFRAPRSVIAQGAGLKSGLWTLGISGDLPIVALRIEDPADTARVEEALLAHEYWRMKRLAADLVILNERPSSYVQDLQAGIESALRVVAARSGASEAGGGGRVHALRADLIGPEACALLIAAARVVLDARRGPLAEQVAASLARSAGSLGRREAPALLRKPPPAAEADPEEGEDFAASLEFFNGTGGFAREGREYAVVLEAGASTPAPWINVVANDGFGFHVSATGAGGAWAQNSRENRLTPWSNDAVSDPAGEAFYIRDEATGAVVSPTARPLRRAGRHVARHGFGYSRFTHAAEGLALDLLQFVPLTDPVKISRLTLRNLTTRPRCLTILSYAEPVMGVTRCGSAPFLITARDEKTGALFVRNPWNAAFPGGVGFADLNGAQDAFTADRTEFLGRGGDLSVPRALISRAPLSGAVGAGYDPCLALARSVDLAPGASLEIAHFLGLADSTEAAQALIARLRAADLDKMFIEVEAHWREVLDTVQIKAPDRAMDILVNGWLPYQTLACRIQARAGFYQASGAYGFRDQLQDGMALTLAQPDRVRAHLIRAAGRQFPEGDVQHWWLPHSGEGVRTRISDDCVWLAYAAADYVATTGDEAVLEAEIPFLEGPPLAAGQDDAFFRPEISDRTATLFAHCAAGLDLCLARTGAKGLPLIGTGDWNDGMNRVGREGRGESVWLGWLLLEALARFAPLARPRDPERATRWEAHAQGLRAALEREAWDGAWYRRATFDDGSWLGSSASPACRIDSIAQSWAALSGQADPERVRSAMQALDRELIRPEPGLPLLFTPPFDAAAPDFGPDPGYVAAYPPGLRENGGQYTHAAAWAVLALTRLGDGDAALRLFALLNPIRHAETPERASRYKVEPYVLAADVYSVAPHEGRGGWTWYTGSAAWLQRAAVEGILGLRRRGDHLTIQPCLPSDWPGFSARLKIKGARLEIEVVQGAGVVWNLLDGVEQGVFPARIPLDGADHVLRLRLPGPSEARSGPADKPPG